MTRTPSRPWIALAFLLTAGPVAAQQKAAPLPPPPGFRTVDTAIVTTISKASPAAVGRSGYLGVHVALEDGKILVAEVAPDSPAGKAGMQTGDVLARLEGQAVGSAEALREFLQGKTPGETVKLAIVRAGAALDLSATLGATSRPMKANARRGVLGVQVDEPKVGEGAAVVQVTPGSGAAAAGLKIGDLVLKVDGVTLTAAARLTDTLAERKPGDIIALSVRRDGKALDLKATLGSERKGGKGGRGGWDTRAGSYWKKDVYRLAVVCVEYPDVAHNPKIASADWEKALFSKAAYTTTSVTGAKVFGSLNDYYIEQSHGRLRVEGKVFDWVKVGKKRGEYAQGTGTGNKGALLTEALDKLLARDGQDALNDIDGLFFLYAGSSVKTTRGGLYWPHKATAFHKGKRWSYFICPEGGTRMNTISVVCHEFGHMLGFPDLYARPENPGSEGVGVWCAMSNQVGNGRPQHFCAWSKEKLGWVEPAVINPTVRQKLVLAPIEDSPRECIKVLARLDGTEYFLLENRRRKGFDQSLPAEGLLIWRVLNNRPVLEESHGVEGPAGPRLFLTAVPYPSQANNAFTPYTTPSSRSQLGGGLPVHITNISRLPDGRITFYVGYEFQ